MPSNSSSTTPKLCQPHTLRPVIFPGRPSVGRRLSLPTVSRTTDTPSPIPHSSARISDASPNLPLAPIDDPLFNDQLMSKLGQCSVRCHFDSGRQDTELKRLKTAALQDILTHVGASADVRTLSDRQITTLIEMVLANVNRSLGEVDAKLFVTDNAPPPTDCAWPHLSLAYEILNKLVAHAPRARCFGVAVVQRVLAQLGAPTAAERDAIAQFVVRYARAELIPLPTVLAMVESAVGVWEASLNHMFAVHCALTAYGKVLHACAGAIVSTQAFVGRIVLPSIMSIEFGFFQAPLADVIGFVAGLYPEVAKEAARLIVRGWPRGIVGKQGALVRTIAVVIPALGNDDKALEMIAPIVAEALRSDAQRIATSALDLIATDAIEKILATPAGAALRTAVVAALAETVRTHWNMEVRGKAKERLDLFGETEGQAGNPFEASRRHRWLEIVRTAHTADQADELARQIAQITALYSEKAID